MTAISVSESSFLACKSDGTVWSGGLGEVVEVNGLPAGVVGVSAGKTHWLVITQDGSVWAWGGGQYGELGNGTDAYSAFKPPARMLFEAPGVPPAPTDLSVQGVTGRNILTWNGISATFYRVYYSTGGTPTKNSPYVDAPSSPFTHAGLTDGTSYYYAVSRINAGGESELTPVASGTPGPHRSIKDGTWHDISVWNCGCTPTELDNVIISHQIANTHPPDWGRDYRVNRITIEPSGTIAFGGIPRIIAENVVNKGTMAGSLIVRGNFEHDGKSNPGALLTFAGPDEHVLSQSDDAEPFNFLITGEAATMTIKAGSDLKFAPRHDNPNNPNYNLSFPVSTSATGTLDMAGHSIIVSSGNGSVGLRVGSAIIKNLKDLVCLEGDGSYFIIPQVENPSFPLRIDSEVKMEYLGVVGNVVIGENGSLVGVSGSSLDIKGNLTVEDGGSIFHTGWGSSLGISLTGNLTQNGTYTPSVTTFAGKATQTIYLGSGKVLPGKFVDSDPSYGLQAASALRFENAYFDLCPGSRATGTLDMAGHALHLRGGAFNPIGADDGFTATNSQIVGVSSINVSNVAVGSDNFTRFGNITFVAKDQDAGITMNGAFIMRDTVTMYGNVTISEGSSLCSGHSLLLKVFGNFSGHVFLHNYHSWALTVQATGYGSITLPEP